MKTQFALIFTIFLLLFSIVLLDDFVDESIINIIKLIFSITFVIFAIVMFYEYYKENKNKDDYTENW
jgi:hypothetical protein